MIDIAVIGGGASGIMCAITAARTLLARGKQYHIRIYEKNLQLGKKILSTGNGRCNLTNCKAAQDCESVYSGVLSDSIAKRVLQEFAPEDTMAFFESIGLQTVVSDDGRVYPASMQAVSVLALMEAELNRLGIEVVCNVDIAVVQQHKKGFSIGFADGKSCDARTVVVATGGNAAPKSGSDGRGFKLLRAMGHSIAPTYPALVGFKAISLNSGALKGVRADNVRATLLQKGKIVASDIGEVQFNDYGLSGIPIMDLSVYGGTNLPGSVVVLDFVPSLSVQKLTELLEKRKNELSHLTAQQLLWGFVNQRVASELLKRAGQKTDRNVCDLPAQSMGDLAKMLKEYKVEISATAGYHHAQSTGGGVNADEFSERLESKLWTGVFACGEVLNVCGICGGYNLQWAWASGYAAGAGAAESVK